MHTILLVALFGAAGCVSRYLLSGWVHGIAGRGFPYGTLAVNVGGSFLIGLVMEAALRTTLIGAQARSGIVIGFLGGFTTFSAFSYETVRLIEDGQLLHAGVNVLAGVAACLLFTWLGIVAGRQLT